MQKFAIKSLALIVGLGIASVQAQDGGQWGGAYGGLTFSKTSGDMIYDDGGVYDLDGQSTGALLGYNYSSGTWVFGAELAYSKGRIEEVGNTNFGFESALDLKARAGYEIGSALVYATVGRTVTQWDEGGLSFDGNGLLYGVGIDYLVSPSFFIGAEYVARDVTSDWNAIGSTLDANMNTLSLRAGIKF
jgi:outer membrane immunogenic protein